MELPQLNSERITIKLINNFNSSTRIDISNLSDGLYFLKITNDKSIKSIKFIKE